MKKITLLFSLLGTITLCNAQSVYSWAKRFSGSTMISSRGIAVDAAGNTYTTGYFTGTVDFDPDAGTQILTSAGDQDFYIAKWNATGSLQWAKSIGGTSEDYGNDIALDAAGNIYVTGEFRLTVDFDPGPGVHTLSSIDPQDIDMFVLKLDADGNYIWAKSMAGNNTSTANGMAVDAAGNVYTTGYFIGITDFDPGPGTQYLGTGGGNIFISKLDANGDYVWAKNVEVTGGFGSGGVSIAVDATGNVYTTGYFSGTADFDPGTGTVAITPVAVDDAYILKLDAAGNYVWAKQLGGVSTQMPTGMALDAAGNVYTTGYHKGTTDFDPGAGTHDLTSNGAEDIYISKLDAAGNYVWAVSLGSSDENYSGEIALDAAGNIYFTGGYQQTIDIDPGTNTQNLVSAGDFDIFIAKFNAAGNYIWATGIGNAAENYGGTIAVTGLDNIYTTGNFMGTIDLDPGTGTHDFTGGNNEAYILHLIPSAPLPLTLLHFDAVDDVTTVKLQWQTTDEENMNLFIIERSADGKIYEAIGSVAAVNNNDLKSNYIFIDAQPLHGNSYYRLKITDRNGPFTYSRIIPVRRQHNAQGLQVFPNPATDVLNVQINAHEATTLKIVDITGHIWQQQNITINGNTTFPVAIQNLPAGFYYLLLKGKNSQQVQPFLKK